MANCAPSSVAAFQRAVIRGGCSACAAVTWGGAQAINAGDALVTRGGLAVLDLGVEGVPAEQVIEAARVLDHCALEIVEGQALDLSFEERLDVTGDGYLERIEKRTGALSH